jgi:hypothetical protein
MEKIRAGVVSVLLLAVLTLAGAGLMEQSALANKPFISCGRMGCGGGTDTCVSLTYGIGGGTITLNCYMSYR